MNPTSLAERDKVLTAELQAALDACADDICARVRRFQEETGLQVYAYYDPEGLYSKLRAPFQLVTGRVRTGMSVDWKTAKGGVE